MLISLPPPPFRPHVPLWSSRQAWVRRMTVLLVLGLMASSHIADAGNVAPLEAKKPDVPNILLALPIALAAGSTNTVQLRGSNLTNITEVRWSAASPLGQRAEASVTNRSTGQADVLKDVDAKRYGDSRIAVTMVVPQRIELDSKLTNALVAVSPAGESAPFPLWIVPAGTFVDEREPNGGWRDASLVGSNQTVRFVRGAILEPADVDVFRWPVLTGERWQVIVHAARYGSALDSVLTLTDAQGHILMSNDDARGGRDSALEWQFATAGFATVTIQDAHDKGSAAHAYVMELIRLPPRAGGNKPRD
jgi:hypothetical protein